MIIDIVITIILDIKNIHSYISLDKKTVYFTLELQHIL